MSCFGLKTRKARVHRIRRRNRRNDNTPLTRGVHRVIVADGVTITTCVVKPFSQNGRFIISVESYSFSSIRPGSPSRNDDNSPLEHGSRTFTILNFDLVHRIVQAEYCSRTAVGKSRPRQGCALTSRNYRKRPFIRDTLVASSTDKATVIITNVLIERSTTNGQNCYLESSIIIGQKKQKQEYGFHW